MSDWPISRLGYAHRLVGISAKVDVTASSTVNTKGSWTQLIASTSSPGYLYVFISMVSGGSDYLVDISIGGAGSETVIIADLLMTCPAAAYVGMGQAYLFPILIPSSTRIAMRAASNVGGAGSGALGVHASIVQDLSILNQAGQGPCVTYGASAADSGGTSIDPGGSAGTKGAWVQFTAASSFEFNGIMLNPGMQQNAIRTTAWWYLDVGLTGAPQNSIIISDLPFFCRTEADFIFPLSTGIIPVKIPKGSEIHIRTSCTITDASDRLLDICLYCFS